MNAVNLIPAEGRKRRLSLSTSPQTLGLIGGLVLVLVAAVFYVTAANKVSSRKSELAKVTAGVAQWQTAVNSYAGFVQTAAQRVDDLAVVRQLAASRFPWSRLLGQIGGVMPADAALTSLQASTASASAAGSATGTTTSGTGATSTPSVPAIQLSGCAKDDSAVAETLIDMRKVQGVSDVTLSSAQSDASSGSSGSSSSGGCAHLPVQFQATVTFSAGSSSSTGSSSAPTGTTTTATTTTSTPATTSSTPASTVSTPAASASAPTPSNTSAAQ